MPKLLSAVRETIQVKLPTRPPSVIGYYETRWPTPIMHLAHGETVDVSPQIAEIILTLHGRKGIIELKDNETPEDAMGRAKEIRLNFLRAFLNRFRNNNAALRAQGVPVLLPRDIHRRFLAEMKALSKEIDGELLTGGDPHGPTAEVDIAARELAEFGLPAESASLVPGVEPGLSGIEL